MMHGWAMKDDHGCLLVAYRGGSGSGSGGGGIAGGGRVVEAVLMHNPV